MSDLALDTHALLWYLEKSDKLSEVAKSAIKQTIASGGVLNVSPISLTEILFLEEKDKLRKGTFQKVLDELHKTNSALVEAPLVSNTVAFIARIPREIVPDMPDRLIAATALSLGLSLVTKDLRIRATSVPTIW